MNYDKDIYYFFFTLPSVIIIACLIWFNVTLLSYLVMYVTPIIHCIFIRCVASYVVSRKRKKSHSKLIHAHVIIRKLIYVLLQICILLGFSLLVLMLAFYQDYKFGYVVAPNARGYSWSATYYMKSILFTNILYGGILIMEAIYKVGIKLYRNIKIKAGKKIEG